MLVDATEFVEMVMSAVRSERLDIVRFGTIDPNWTTGDPKVTWDGESGLSAAAYKTLSSYDVTASDRIVAMKMNKAWVILGEIGTYTEPTFTLPDHTHTEDPADGGLLSHDVLTGVSEYDHHTHASEGISGYTANDSAAVTAHSNIGGYVTAQKGGADAIHTVPNPGTAVEVMFNMQGTVYNQTASDIIGGIVVEMSADGGTNWNAAALGSAGGISSIPASGQLAIAGTGFYTGTPTGDLKWRFRLYQDTGASGDLWWFPGDVVVHVVRQR